MESSHAILMVWSTLLPAYRSVIRLELYCYLYTLKYFKHKPVIVNNKSHYVFNELTRNLGENDSKIAFQVHSLEELLVMLPGCV